MDIELAVQAIQLSPTLDHLVLFSGDGDFRSLVADLQLRGKRVSVISTLHSSPPMIADELRRQADQFIDLADLEPIICRDPSARQARYGRRPGRTRRAAARPAEDPCPTTVTTSPMSSKAPRLRTRPASGRRATL